MPDGEPGDRLTFKALQTYAGGEVVRWIGPADADEPAPRVTLTEASGESGGHDDDAATRAAAPAEAAGDDDGGDTLAIVALAIGALGLLAGGAGLMVARRAPGRAVPR